VIIVNVMKNMKASLIPLSFFIFAKNSLGLVITDCIFSMNSMLVCEVGTNYLSFSINSLTLGSPVVTAFGPRP